MSALTPAAGDALLSDTEMALCLRHYVVDKPARAWIGEADTAPELVWGPHASTVPQGIEEHDNASHGTAAASLPVQPPRWRDQYLKLRLPKAVQKARPRPNAALPAQRAAVADPEYVLISEDEEEVAADDEDALLSSTSPSQQPPSSLSEDKGVAAKRVHRGHPTTSPSPRRSGGDGGSLSTSPASRAAQRLSTGSSVIYVSQPAKKTAGPGAVRVSQRRSPSSKSVSHSQEEDGGNEVGKKRQRSMEEFLYRGA